jgi:hypothetical protein
MLTMATALFYESSHRLLKGNSSRTKCSTSNQYCGTDKSEPVASAKAVILVHKQAFSIASLVMQHQMVVTY